MPHSQLRYRPEIDGLRAIAVIPVVLFHANFTSLAVNPFKGGFLGVDIFFVISGYLITSILLREMQDNNFTYLGFYERRARRILPALFLVMAASLPLAWILMLPKAFKEYIESLIATTLFSSNILFWLQDSYTAEPSMLKPFLHTWSLGVEEQYYLLFPVLLLLCWKYARAHLGGLLAFGLALSAGLAFWGSYAFADAAFFLLPTRIWELLAGGLLAKYESDRGRAPKTTSGKFMPFIGLILIMYAVGFYDNHEQFSVAQIGLVVAGTAMLIHYSGGGDPVSLLLSSKFFVGIGLVSYSFYLWHQPVFVFARLGSSKPPNDLEMLSYIALCIGLSYLSWKYVEQPFRNKAVIPRKTLWTSLSAAAAVFTGLGFAGMLGMGSAQNLPPIAEKVLLTQKQSPNLKQGDKPCLGRAVENACHFGGAEAKVKWAIIGDSHMDNLSAVFWEKARDRDWQLTMLTMNGCHYAVGADALFKGWTKYCTANVNLQRQNYLRNNPDTIAVIGGRLPLYLSREYFDNKEGGVETGDPLIMRAAGTDLPEKERRKVVAKLIVQSVEELLREGHKVVLVYPIPEVGWRVPQKFVQSIPKRLPEIQDWLTHKGVTTSYDVYKERAHDAFAVYDSVPDHPNLLRVYPHKLFCDTRQPGRCITHDSNDVFYVDNDHLSYAGSRLVVDKILQEVKARWGI